MVYADKIMVSSRCIFEYICLTFRTIYATIEIWHGTWHAMHFYFRSLDTNTPTCTFDVHKISYCIIKAFTQCAQGRNVHICMLCLAAFAQDFHLMQREQTSNAFRFYHFSSNQPANIPYFGRRENAERTSGSQYGNLLCERF